jgi:hypothetical protein
VPQDVRDKLHPWLREVVDADSANLQTVIKSRWNDLRSECLKELSTKLRAFRPRSVAVYTKGNEFTAWLIVERELPAGFPREGFFRNGDILLIPPPTELDVNRVDDKKIIGFLSELDPANREVLREFLANFTGMQRLIMQYWGFWPGVCTEEVLPDLAADWSPCLALFDENSGYYIIVSREGKVGWYFQNVPGEIDLLATNIEGFIRYLSQRIEERPFAAGRLHVKS